MFVSIFSTNKDKLKELAMKLRSSGLVYPAYGMFMIQATVTKKDEVRDCFKFNHEWKCTNFCATHHDAMAAHVPNMEELE